MRTKQCVGGLAVVVISLVSVVPPVLAQGRTEVTIDDTTVSPENLTSSQNGTVFFGSTAKGTIYRATPGAAQAEAWIQASTSGLTNTMGVLADDKSNTLWVCQNAMGRPGGPPAGGQTALRAFDLKSGAAKGTYPFPDGGMCNDIAVSADGTTYATEPFGGRVMRLNPGAAALDVWVADPQQLAVVDGLSFLADGAVYVNTYFAGKLFRIPVKPDGSAGPIVPLETSAPLGRPDGLRTVGPKTLLQAEGEGRLSEITIDGNRAEVRVVKDGLTGATGVTLVGDTALVLAGRLKAVAVPYRLGAQFPAARTPSVAVANLTYVATSMEIVVDRPAADVCATTSKLVYSVVFDNSMLPDDAARQADVERRRGMFTQALQNMKILAEGGTLPPAPARGGRPGGGGPAGREQ